MQANGPTLHTWLKYNGVGMILLIVFTLHFDYCCKSNLKEALFLTPYDKNRQIGLLLQ